MKLSNLTFTLAVVFACVTMESIVGCATGGGWVKADGSPPDPLVLLRCEEYVNAKNGPRFTGFESYDRAECLRAHGYKRSYEVAR